LSTQESRSATSRDAARVRTIESASIPRDVPFPRYAIGLLQSESEMLQVPEYDLAAFLESDRRWDVELFTERTVHALLDSPDRFDCVVVGYNAAHKSGEIREALERNRPGVGLCVLHQLTEVGFRFLDGDDRLRFEEQLPPGKPVAAQALETKDEILLNWQEEVPLEKGRLDRSLAYAGVSPASAGRWRTVLEVVDKRNRTPVLLRSHSGRWPPVVVCTALLSPRYHRELLGNILLWCASGPPSAVVVSPPDDHRAAAVHRRLRLQGTPAVAKSFEDPKDLDFDRWPLRGIRDVLLPAAWDPTKQTRWPDDDPHNARAWLRGGGRIVVMGTKGDLTIYHAETDVHAVLRQWAAWFEATPPHRWCGHGDDEKRGSIVASRAVLQVLAAVHGQPANARAPGLRGARRALEVVGLADVTRLGVPSAGNYADPIREMLRERIGSGDSVEGTVSATVAALDLDALLEEGALSDGTRMRLRSWLLERLDGSAGELAALEDRLEMARYFGEPELLQTVLGSVRDDPRLKAPLSAVLVTTARSAIAACGLTPDDPAVASLPVEAKSVVENDLRTRPMLAARYLLGVSDLQAAWESFRDELEERWKQMLDGGLSDPAAILARPLPDIVDRAVITIGRYAPLLRGSDDGATPDPELVSTEALALIAYFGADAVPSHVLGGAHLVPHETLSAVLLEAEKLRRENEDRRKDERLLDQLSPVIAGAGLMLVLAVVALAWWLVATLTDVEIVWELSAAFLLWSFLTLALLNRLVRLGLRLRWAKTLADGIADGVGGLTKRLAAATSQDTDAESRDR
jgi:hypothetical protein